jgi:hypothetical protein
MGARTRSTVRPRPDRAAGCGPSPEADRRTLVRRLSFDLTGLPPTPEEVDAFVADPSPAAYERLATGCWPRPGTGSTGPAVARRGPLQRQQRVRLGRVPAARVAVPRLRRPSFNADKPFDRFVREQLAGDELLDGPPRTPAEQDCLVATGYLRLGRTTTRRRCSTSRPAAGPS